MALYKFTAARQDGSPYTDTREAADKQTLISDLKLEGLTPIAVSETAPKRFNLNITLFSRIPNAEKITFARNLSAMAEAGLSVSRALTVLEKQTKNKGLKAVIRGISDEVTKGSTLHDAFARYPKVFPKLFVAMTRAGEESGTLAKSLGVVANQMERAYQLTKKVRGAMIYPAIVITVMLIIFVLMLIHVVPTLADTFEDLNTQLPAPTQFLISASDLFVTHYIALSAALAVIVMLGILAARYPFIRRLFDLAMLKFPVIGGIVEKVNAARTARTLSSLLSAGVPALTALEITGEVVQNSVFKPVIAHASELVEKGKPISDAFTQAENIYPVMFSEMAAVGEETGDLSAMLGRVADFYEGEVEQQTRDLSTVVEPLLMVVIGGGVGFFAIAMIAPIYSLSGSI